MPIYSNAIMAEVMSGGTHGVSQDNNIMNVIMTTNNNSRDFKLNEKVLYHNILYMTIYIVK